MIPDSGRAAGGRSSRQRRALCAARQHVVNGGQLVEIEPDRRCNVLRVGPRCGNAHRNEFAHVPHLSGRERGLLGNLEARQARNGADRFDAREIVCRENFAAMRGRDVDAADVGVGEGAANKGDILHAMQPQIRDELTPPPHQTVVFLAQDGSTDTMFRHSRGLSQSTGIFAALINFAHFSMSALIKAANSLGWLATGSISRFMNC